MPKMMSPNTSVWWVTDATFDVNAPAAALLTAAADISCAIETGYKLGPTASDTDSSTTICDSSKVETMTAYNYQGSLSFFREGDLADTSSAFYRAFQFFRSGTQNGNVEGFLVRRVGYPQGTAPAAGQRVDSFKFIPDNPQDVVSDKNPVKITVTFHPQGLMGLHKALV